jgi:hypothetical protein
MIGVNHIAHTSNVRNPMIVLTISNVLEYEDDGWYDHPFIHWPVPHMIGTSNTTQIIIRIVTTITLQLIQKITTISKHILTISITVCPIVCVADLC